MKVQCDQPDYKKPYFVIDKVRFIDSPTKSIFPTDYIEINENLTTIIGGKSTGKSLLLYLLAKTINKNEVENRLKPIESFSYDFEKETDFNFEVIWADKRASLLKLGSIDLDTERQEARKILYLPQNYLNRISEGVYLDLKP